MCCLGTTVNGSGLLPFSVICECHGIKQVYDLVIGYFTCMFDVEEAESLEEALEYSHG
jgi:hypothetical protein